MAASGEDPDRQDLRARLRRVQEGRKAAQAGGGPAQRGDMTALARGLRIGAEFVAAILVGTGIGWLIDQAAGTAPWALLIMFMLGFAAGILNVTRVVAELNAQNAAPTGDADKPD